MLGARDTEGLVSDVRPSAPGPGSRPRRQSSRGRQRTGYGMSHTGPAQQRSDAMGLGISEMCRDIDIYISVDFFVNRYALATTY